jgi:2-polyprenyl-6-hydroxyphenyl methylase/3-demethylubiquinone-9 3-methyltransferase
VERGSALDERYLNSLGKFNVVYSWGVLHHTGDMWTALDNIIKGPTADRLLVAIYNDQDGISRRWRWLKKKYNNGGYLSQRAAEIAVWIIAWGKFHMIDLIALKPFRTIKVWQNYRIQRGMSPWHDIVDWAGGYPFEVAKPEEVFGFVRQRGFELEKLTTCGGGKGCNEFLFSRRNHKTALHSAEKSA